MFELKGEHAKRDRDLDQAFHLDPNIEKTWRDFVFSDTDKSWNTWSDEFSARTRGKTYRQLFWEGHAAYERGDYQRSIAINNDVLAMKISAAEASLATMNRGAAYQAKGDLDKALRDFDEAIRLDPHNAGAYVDRGLVRSIKGAHDKALTDFEEAIRLNPNQREAYYNRTTDLWDAGKRDEIVADLTRTMELNPSFPGAYARRADIY